MSNVRNFSKTFVMSKKHDYLVLFSQPILLTSTLMMETYRVTPAELATEIYIALICFQIKHWLN